MDTGDRKRRIIIIYLLILTVVVLEPAQKKRRKRLPYYRLPISYPRGDFNFYEWDDERFRRSFRFNKAQIPRLAQALKIYAVPWRHKIQPDPETALCLVLYRLSWPHRYSELAQIFCKSPIRLSTVFNDVCIYLWREWHELVVWHPMLNDYGRLRKYAKSIKRALGNNGPLTF